MPPKTEHELITEIGKIIDRYSTALIRINAQVVNPLKDLFMGCGTFVRIGERYGILTAHHVAEQFASPCELGLILELEVATRYTINSDHFVICNVAIPDRVTERPDLAFIEIFHPDVGEIKARKQFVNLTGERATVLPNPRNLNDADTGWFIWGAAAERNTIEPPEGGLKTILGIHGLCGPGKAVKEVIEDEHDYIDIEVRYGDEYETPRSFGGYSGGGLWQVPIEGLDTDSPNPTDCIFSGVIFYQSDRVGNTRFLNCHGRRSVYDFAYKKIENRCA